MDGIVAHNVADRSAAKDVKSRADLEKKEKSVKPELKENACREQFVPGLYSSQSQHVMT